MALINNKRILSVGVRRFDEEHSFLVEFTNQLHDSIKTEAGQSVDQEALKRLSEFAHSHFRGEEELLELHNYPGLEEQRLAHNQLLERLYGIQADFLSNNASAEQQLLQYLLDWLTQHTKEVDRLYGPFLNARGIF